MKRKKVSGTPKKRRRRRRRFSLHVEQLELRAGLTDLLGVGAAFFGNTLPADPIAAEYSFADEPDGSQLELESGGLDADTPLQLSLAVLEPGASSFVQNPGATLVAGNPSHQPQNWSAPSATAGTAIGPAVSSAVLNDLPTNDNLLASFGADITVGGAPGETLILAGPETEVIIITPYQQTEPSESTTFDGEFVVRLRPDVSSETQAAEFGFVHSFAYPNTGENLNVWRTPDDVAPGTRLFGWMRTNADNPERLAQRLESRPEVLDAYPVYKTSVVPKTNLDDPVIQTEKLQ